MKEIPLAATGRPGPWGLVAPAFLLALAGWLAAAVALLASGDALARVATWDGRLVLAVHFTGLVLFPFAVAGGAWHALPPMLRNSLPRPGRLRLALVLLLGSVPLAAGVALDVPWLGAVGSVMLVGALALVAGSVVGLVLSAPPGRTLVAGRTGVALAILHAVLAFALGAALFGGDGAELLGLARERLLLVHFTLAAVGWLAVLLIAVGRVLDPMLALAAAPRKRRFPLQEVAVVAALWPALAGVALGVRPLALAGAVALAAALAPFGAAMVRAGVRGKIGLREGPLAHVLIGGVSVVQGGLVALAGLGGLLDERRAATAYGVLLVGGFAAGILVGHAGKLLALSAWANWPPGPRPRQEALYPRRAWQAEAILFLVATQLLADGTLLEAPSLVRAGAAVLVAAAATALAAALLTLQRVLRAENPPSLAVRRDVSAAAVATRL